MSEWLPIETAPRDGSIVLLWAPNARDKCEGDLTYTDCDVVVGRWQKSNWHKTDENHEPTGQWESDLVEFEVGWESTGSYTRHHAIKPTHWMPLPSPPEQGA